MSSKVVPGATPPSSAAAAGKTSFVSSLGSSAPFAVFLILTGCCLNVVTLELITRRDPGAGHLITVAQFVFIAASTGLVLIWRKGASFFRTSIPFHVYLALTAIFFVLSLLNNKALDFDISIPIHTVFRSSSLVSNLLVGLFIFHRRYPAGKIVACVLVTLGIVCTTLADMARRKGTTLPALLGVTCCGFGSDVDLGATLSQPVTADDPARQFWFLVGIGMLTAALFLSAMLGQLQGWAYRTHGKFWFENLFWTHFLSLPMFLSVSSDVLAHIEQWKTEPPVVFHTGAQLVGDVHLSLWALLVLNVLLQLVCILGVFILTSSAGTLTCTFTITFRKFVSLLFSVLYFRNPFGAFHQAGTALVFLGGILFTLTPSSGDDTKSDAAGKKKTQ